MKGIAKVMVSTCLRIYIKKLAAASIARDCVILPSPLFVRDGSAMLPQYSNEPPKPGKLRSQSMQAFRLRSVDDVIKNT